MRNLRICDVGLAPDTSHAFHSMLKVVAGRSKAAWTLAPTIGDADVMIAGCDGDPASFARWGASGKPVVLVIDDRGSWPPAPYVLRHPFRVMQLLSILDDVAEQLQPRAPSLHAAVDDEAWCAAESLRRIMPHAGGDDWHCARAANGDVFWIGHGAAHATPSTLARLRERALAFETFEATRSPAPATTRAMPLCDFAWYVGLHGSSDLAPWLSPGSDYRLRRWPDFGRLGLSPGLVELCAHAATRAWTPSALASATDQPLASVNRFLNAASLAGLLGTAHATTAATDAGGGIPGGWRRMIGGLRRRLGLAA